MSILINTVVNTNETPFAAFGLSKPLQKAIADQGYDTPTPVQLEAIPPVLAGRDVMAAAQTGTCKTAGFTLPLLQRLTQAPQNARSGVRPVRALIVTPTRELAAQVAESVETYGKYLDIRTAVIFGGVSAGPQISALRRGVDVLVATPGRLLDLVGQKVVSFSGLEVLVLDEADRMLDMGFIHDIRRIIRLLPTRRQTLLFSATFSKEIRGLAEDFLTDPVRIDITPVNAAAETVTQWLHPVEKASKPKVLSHLITHHGWEQVLVFTRTKHGANRLAKKLVQDGINATAIHGNKSQGARTRALAGFKDGSVRVLVATDIAARGLDIEELPQVVNFELPNVPEDYVHRIGRTGRAGLEGRAMSLVSEDEAKQLFDIERLLKQTLPRELVAGFEPSTDFLKNPRPNPAAASGGNARSDSHGAPKQASSRNRRSRGPKRAGGSSGSGPRQGSNAVRKTTGDRSKKPSGS
ncbi:DEAD/DEAH box helicase [soil metagenome]